ncbi:MAG TPA: galactose oxidase-like domain-containing protein [Candidatus Udaeobacter sp.]|nr:galactose oxidase-like domain-containing protein [Candidatus Udaeobacter sp.]
MTAFPSRSPRPLVFLAAAVLSLALMAWGTPAGAQPPSTKGAWAGPYALPDVAIHFSLLPSGKTLMWADDDDPQYPVDGTRRAGKTRVFVVTVPSDSFPGLVEEIDNTQTNLFCAGQTLLADGRLIAVGGHMGMDGFGSAETNVFSFSGGPYTWTHGQNMANGRWYPTAVTLPDGNVVVVAGTSDEYFTVNSVPELWNVADGSWTELTDATESVLFYPWLHVAPNGQVFNAGPEWSTGYLDYHGTGSWTTVGNHLVGNRDYGSSVMYDDGKILVVGGADPPTNTTEVIDLNAASPAWQYSGTMKSARRHCNATLLPDGKVFVDGGTSSSGFNTSAGTVYTSEMWDPATGTFSTMASMTVPRLYHSTAVLLPDGRVMSAGSGRPKPTDGGADQPWAEFYSPPYLFKGTRPVITSAPSSVSYGQTFFVPTPDGASITKVTWIRLSASTHAFNMNQRINRLSFAATTGGLNVTAPSNPNLCPPGHYMLFILNGTGVPSKAKIVQIVPANVLAADPGTATLTHLAFGSPSPNPSRGTTRFSVGLPKSSDLSVDLLDLQGREVRALHRGPAPAGWLNLTWDGADESGRPAAPGLYFALARAGQEQARMRFVRVR